MKLKILKLKEILFSVKTKKTKWGLCTLLLKTSKGKPEVIHTTAIGAPVIGL